MIPQIYKNWKRGSTDGVPSLMLFVWAISEVPMGAYVIIQKMNIPIQIQPQILAVLCLVTWAQTLVMTHKWRVWTAVLTTFATGAIFAVMEVLLVIGLNIPYKRGVDWPVLFIGILAGVMLGLGLLPLYYEGWKRGGRAEGVSTAFLFTDILGAFFSLLALIAQSHFDLLGGIQYSVVLALEVGLLLLHAVWLWNTRKIRAAAKRNGQTYDEYVSSDSDGPKGAKKSPSISSHGSDEEKRSECHSDGAKEEV
ncbi:hypothetical protein K402DRAFT_351365 [Aulographum hederae CBS 113979]|uniref:PQ loop repeat protein n=1 Tax=Aulographum hederae CBS 113979 TaxID=1176131 RepID=A0A6G1H724_9PEZI|nr:hypothetical protein K402DRAFT_351365 [Aulographum hederae CBS 113979]